MVGAGRPHSLPPGKDGCPQCCAMPGCGATVVSRRAPLAGALADAYGRTVAVGRYSGRGTGAGRPGGGAERLWRPFPVTTESKKRKPPEEVSEVMYWDGGGWAWMAFMPLLWIALIGLVVWAAIRLTQHPAGRDTHQDRGQPPPRETPEEILDRRFAAGEIDADTYTEARQRLAAHKPRPR